MVCQGYSVYNLYHYAIHSHDVLWLCIKTHSLLTMKRFNFGNKYKGRLLSDVFKIDPQYIKWAYNNTDKLNDLPLYYKQCLNLK